MDMIFGISLFPGLCLSHMLPGRPETAPFYKDLSLYE